MGAPGTVEFDLGEESLPRAHPIAYFEERSGRFHLPVHFGIRVTTDDETLELLPQLGDGYEVEAILEATGCRLTLISRRTTTQSAGF